MIILGLDPGPENFGGCVIDLRPDWFTVKDAGFIENTVYWREAQQTDKKSFGKPLGNAANFIGEISNIITHWQVETVVVERFQSRPGNRLKDENTERSCAMVGMVMSAAVQCNLPDTRMLGLLPSQWKVSIGKEVIKRCYQTVAKECSIPQSECNHWVDACLMALYAGCRMMGYDRSYHISPQVVARELYNCIGDKKL